MHLPGGLLLVAVVATSEALRVLGRNKLRSARTTSAITIGIAAVVCVVALGNASAERGDEQLHNLGDDLVWIEAGWRSVSGVRTGSHGTTSLTLEDAKAILREIPDIRAVNRGSAFDNSADGVRSHADGRPGDRG